MKQSVALITLGVADVERAATFYRSLGWEPVLAVEGTVFYQANGVVVVLWDRALLAADMGIDDAGPGGWGGMALAHNVASQDEVDAIVERARAVGATVTREPAETFYGGYAGGFRDPDGHAWEIACNPGFPLLPDGSVAVGGEGGGDAPPPP
ncbi:MAG: VOC family protein [Acidimicrobiales bacterium]